MIEDVLQINISVSFQLSFEYEFIEPGRGNIVFKITYPTDDDVRLDGRPLSFKR